MPDGGSGARAKVLVLGGGFGGVETSTYLVSEVPEKVDVTLVSSEQEFLFRPNTIYIPFGLNVEKLKFPLAPALAKKHVAFIHGTAGEVDPDNKRVSVERAAGGTESLSYDYLVISTGAAVRPAEIQGMEEHAHTPWTPAEMSRLGDGFRQLVERAERQERTKALFLIPPNNKCAGPLYELVLMFDTWLRRKRVRDWVTITWTTSENHYIQVFGPRMHGFVEKEFARRGIDGHTGWVVDHVESDAVHYKNGEAAGYDLLCSFPPYVAARTYPGLASDDRGFIQCADLGSRRAKDHPEIFVPGDAGDFPIKQAFLAFLEADAAASNLAAEIKGTSPAYDFDPISMCVMEQLDKAMFAQVPLELTGDPSLPVRVRPGMESAYKIGMGKSWRLGKSALAYYLPFRFKAGNPFHSGAPWKAMDVALKGMSMFLAR